MSITSLPILPSTLEPIEYNQNYVLYWNDAMNDLLRITVTIGGPQADPPGSSRALGIFHICLNDAYFAIKPNNNSPTYLSAENPNPALRLPALNGATDARQAVAGAAITCLNQLFGAALSTTSRAVSNVLDTFIQQKARDFPSLQPQSASYFFGATVAQTLLAYLNDTTTTVQGNYTPVGEGQVYKFDSDPTNPVRIVPVDVNNPDGPTKVIRFFDAPFYGQRAKRLAVQGVVNGQTVQHLIGDPPVGFSLNNQAEYDSAFKEVYAEGGAVGLNTTHRTPKQQEKGFFWAYDGVKLLGTPIRHYSQILRRLAWTRKPAGPTDEATNADFIRVFALCTAAMADAGIYCWLEKYYFSFWRPLSGVRQDNTNPLQDPFWLTLGAPETNSNGIPFKPPFPAYPSGHAAFGGAFFQCIRLYYKRRDNLTFADDAPDNISFDARSDELNGINRDQLRMPYDPTQPITDQIGVVRTNVGLVHFHSCWQAMFDNAISRVFLGVHWGFDAFAAKDVQVSQNIDGTVNYKNVKDIKYATTGPRGDRPGQFPIGGVPLGIGIANDIFQSKLKPTPAALQPPFNTPSGEPAPHKVQLSASNGAQEAAGDDVHEMQNGNETNGDEQATKGDAHKTNGAEQVVNGDGHDPNGNGHKTNGDAQNTDGEAMDGDAHEPQWTSNGQSNEEQKPLH